MSGNGIDWGEVKADLERVAKRHRLGEKLYLSDYRVASELTILLITMHTIADVAALHGAAQNPA